MLRRQSIPLQRSLSSQIQRLKSIIYSQGNASYLGTHRRVKTIYSFSVQYLPCPPPIGRYRARGTAGLGMVTWFKIRSHPPLGAHSAIQPNWNPSIFPRVPPLWLLDMTETERSQAITELCSFFTSWARTKDGHAITANFSRASAYSCTKKTPLTPPSPTHLGGE